jgi:hypothetical protein
MLITFLWDFNMSLKRTGEKQMPKFRKGQSGNPSGRPKGAKDKRTALREILDNHSEELVGKAVELALQGDLSALRLCFDRLMPPLRSKDTSLIIEGMASADRPSLRANKVMEAVSTGSISPTEASSLMNTILSQTKILEIDDLERRLTQLEKGK